MKIDLDRLCRLAGLDKSAKSLNEASNRSYHEDPALDKEREVQFSNQLNETEEAYAEEGMGHDAMEEEEEGVDHAMEEAMGDYNEADDEEGPAPMDEADASDLNEEVDMDEVIEVDEAMLVQELRRARAMLSEAKVETKPAGEPEELTEAQLRKLVADEVAAAMKDFNLTSGWVYGDNKPTISKRGQVVTSMPGIGFKKV